MTDEVPLATAEPFRVPTAPCRPEDESYFPAWEWTPEDLPLLPIDQLFLYCHSYLCLSLSNNHSRDENTTMTCDILAPSVCDRT